MPVRESPPPISLRLCRPAGDRLSRLRETRAGDGGDRWGAGTPPQPAQRARRPRSRHGNDPRRILHHPRVERRARLALARWGRAPARCRRALGDLARWPCLYVLLARRRPLVQRRAGDGAGLCRFLPPPAHAGHRSDQGFALLPGEKCRGVLSRHVGRFCRGGFPRPRCTHPRRHPRATIAAVSRLRGERTVDSRQSPRRGALRPGLDTAG